jgi:ATP-dependent protease ClpP protease subunit
MYVLLNKDIPNGNNFDSDKLIVINRMANKRAYLKIQNDIGKYDQFAADFGLEPITFSAKDMAAFIEANKEATEFEIEIRSDGGSVDEAFDIHDQLLASGKRIITIGYQVASASTIPFMAAKKADRHLAKNALFLPHFPLVGLCGWFRTGDLESVLEGIKIYDSKIVNFYAKDLGIDGDADKVGDLEQMMAKDIPLSVEDVLSWGFAGDVLDNVVAINKDKVRVIAFTEDMIRAHRNRDFNNNDMSKETNTLLTKLVNILTPVAKKLGVVAEGDTPEVVATTTNLSDGSPIYSDGEIVVDTKVFSDETMTTPVGDGDHELEDKRTITVGNGDGTVTAIADAPEATSTPDVKDEEIKNLKLQLAAKTKEEVKLKSQVQDIVNTVEQLKKTVPGGSNPNNDEGNNAAVKAHSVASIMAKIAKDKNQKK